MVMQRLKRMLKHGLSSDWQRRRCFPSQSLDKIEAAIRDCESAHAGEIRFAVETALPFRALWQNQSPRERAIAIFAQQHVWDTEHNNGVLVYVLLAERDVEIVADRGVGNTRVDAREWEACCQVMEEHFRRGEFEVGAVAGIQAVAAVLQRHPPALPDAGNELPNSTILL